MFRQYREIEPGEFFVVGGDCSQGGADYNACQFMSVTKLDFPLVYHSRGVAAQMTAIIHPMLEKLHDVTGISPVVAFERNNGGASEMERLAVLNRLNKYTLFLMPTIGQIESNETKRYGYDTNTATRPVLLGDLKNFIDNKGGQIYDKPTVNELFSFIIAKNGKPQAEDNSHDDLVMAKAICVQMYQICPTPTARGTIGIVKNHNKVNQRKWAIG